MHVTPLTKSHGNLSSGKIGHPETVEASNGGNDETGSLTVKPRKWNQNKHEAQVFKYYIIAIKHNSVLSLLAVSENNRAAAKCQFKTKDITGIRGSWSIGFWHQAFMYSEKRGKWPENDLREVFRKSEAWQDLVA